MANKVDDVCQKGRHAAGSPLVISLACNICIIQQPKFRSMAHHVSKDAMREEANIGKAAPHVCGQNGRDGQAVIEGWPKSCIAQRSHANITDKHDSS